MARPQQSHPWRRMPALLLVALVVFALACGRAAAGSAAPEGRSPPVAGAPGAAPAADADVERIAREATWASGQLRAHFEKHGRDGPYPNAEAYDASARETIRTGRQFTYVDRSTNARRLGFYHESTNRFTAVTQDGRRITTHFKPDNGERYVRSLPQTTYR